MTAERAITAAAVACAVGLCAFVLRPVAASPGAPALALTAAEGKMRIVNSKQGEAILSAFNWHPGRAVKGKVAIHNAGGAHGAFRLSAKRIDDRAGPSGGRLSRITRVRVSRKRPVINSRELVYRGRLGRLRGVRVGDWPAGGTRYFKLRANLVPKSADADRFQRSELRFDFIWRVRARP